MASEAIERLIDALSRPGAMRQDVEEDTGDVTMEGLHNMATRIPAQAGLPVDALAMAMAGAGMTDSEPGEFVGSTEWIQELLGGNPDAPESVVADFVSPDPMDAARAASNIDKLMEALIVFHGSPHKWDKVDLGKIGTGEGAQAYGHGFYAAESPETAKYYATDPAKTGYKPYVEYKGVRTTEMDDRDKKAAVEVISDYGKDKAKQLYAGTGKEDKEFIALMESIDEADIKRGVDEILPEGGNLYELDLPDETIAKMLDWDKPLSEQPESVRKALAEIDPDMYHPKSPDYDAAERGQDTYQYLTSKMDEGDDFNTRFAMKGTGGYQKRASERLNELGIPGIKYLDGTSRNAGKGTSNYVVFGEDDITPLTRNSIPINDPMTTIRNKWGDRGVKLDAYESETKPIITLSKIEVPKSERSAGAGSEAMQDLISHADNTGKTVVLSPSTDFGGSSVNRLKKFYKRFGFVENSGKNKDYTISESMYRVPIER